MYLLSLWVTNPFVHLHVGTISICIMFLSLWVLPYISLYAPYTSLSTSHLSHYVTLPN